MLKKCIYGGGDLCKRQGGDGALDHGADYAHSFPTTAEIGGPVGDFVSKSQFAAPSTPHGIGLEVDFDEDKSTAILNLEIYKGIVDVADLIKSLYDFDIESEEGVIKILELLPIMDAAIVVELMEKIWPGYVVEDADPELLRAEIRGFFLDYLDGQFEDAGTFEPTDLDTLGTAPEGEEADEDEVGVDGDESGDSEAANETEDTAEEPE